MSPSIGSVPLCRVVFRASPHVRRTSDMNLLRLIGDFGCGLQQSYVTEFLSIKPTGPIDQTSPYKNDQVLASQGPGVSNI